MHLTAIVIAAGLALAVMLPAAPAQAQNGRSFVSGHGLDTNACTLAAPCRTFAVAFAHTNAGGEIDVLDTAGYGPLVINKAISIVSDGAVASVLVPSGGTGISISAGPSDVVSLRGLTIEGAGAGQTGIQFNTGKSLSIDHCVVHNLTSSGIAVTPSTSSLFSISSTILSSAHNAIFVVPTGSAVVTGMITDVQANNGNIGIYVDGGSSTGATLRVTIVNSVASSNTDTGIASESTTGKAATSVFVRNSVMNYNGNGLLAVGSVVRIGHSVATGNDYGLNYFDASLDSYGDNDVDGNNIIDVAGGVAVISSH
jgi:hypothetical protein